eukprot:32525-Pleurochrysis_carterae.AAC.2
MSRWSPKRTSTLFCTMACSTEAKLTSTSGTSSALLVNSLNDCAASRNNYGIALASGDDGWETLLSGPDHLIGLG